MTSKKTLIAVKLVRIAISLLLLQLQQELYEDTKASLFFSFFLIFSIYPSISLCFFSLLSLYYRLFL
jgi:hypothetical protein